MAGVAKVARLPGPFAIATVADANDRWAGAFVRASLLDQRAAAATDRLTQVLPGSSLRALLQRAEIQLAVVNSWFRTKHSLLFHPPKKTSVDWVSTIGTPRCADVLSLSLRLSCLLRTGRPAEIDTRVLESCSSTVGSGRNHVSDFSSRSSPGA